MIYEIRHSTARRHRRTYTTYDIYLNGELRWVGFDTLAEAQAVLETIIAREDIT